MPKKLKYIHIGSIIALYGIRGEVKIQSFADNARNFLSFKCFYDQYGNIIPLKLRLVGKNKIIGQLNGIKTREEAEKLIGIKLFVQYQEVECLNKDEYLYEDLIGLKVLDINHSLIGSVKALHNFGAGDIIEVIYSTTNETEFFSFNRETIPEVNIEQGYIILIYPEMI